MDPRKTPELDPEDAASGEAPALEQQDWDAVVSSDLTPESTPENEEPNGELPEEDDDNPYQNSDEALPDDSEEAAIARDAGSFDDV